RSLVFSLAGLASLATMGRADEGVVLRIEPGTIHLQGANRQQQLLVTARLPDGRLQDVTHDCQLAIDQPLVARLAGTVVLALKNGQAEVRVKAGAAEARAAVRVSGLAAYPDVHVANDVAPLFAKHGCNSAGCHGKASGQNGFKLSVFGFDPEADYQAL